MSQDNHFQQYGYDQYLKAPKKKRPAAPGSIGNVLAPKFQRLQNPAFATAALLLTGAVFAGVIVMSYPSGNREDREIPIVRADLRPIKVVPDERGGMDIPNSDSTILAQVGQDTPDMSSAGHVENLLQKTTPNDYVSKEQALESAMTQNPYVEGGQEGLTAQETEEAAPPSQDNLASTGQLMLEAEEAPSQPAPEQVAAIEEKEAVFVSEAKPVEPSMLLQKIEPAADGRTAAAKPKLHAAATSPETLDFVRNVLNEKESGGATEKAEVAIPTQDSGAAPAEKEISTASATEAPIEISDPEVAVPIKPASAPEKPKQAVLESPIKPEAKPAPVQKVEAPAISTPEKVEPSAGIAAPALDIRTGDYYVQLASISERARADKEWAKMQSDYGVLSGVSYRVQSADLGSRGTFFRIQAGPFSKDTASAVCNNIKTKKPGGCLVVQ